MIEELINHLKDIPEELMIYYIKSGRNEHTFLAKSLGQLSNQKYELEYKPHGTNDRIDLVIHENNRLILAMELKVRLSHHIYANSKYTGLVNDLKKLQRLSLNNLVLTNNTNRKEIFSLILIKHLYSTSKIPKEWSEHQRYNKSGDIIPYQQNSNIIRDKLEEQLKKICRTCNQGFYSNFSVEKVDFIKKDINVGNLPTSIKASLLYGLINV